MERGAIPRLERLERRIVPTLLYNNGPYITGIGNGFGGADTSAIEQPNGTTYGWASYKTTELEFHIADDFTVPAGQSWRIAQVKVLSYQTNSGTGNTFSKLNYRIWSGNPSAGGNVVLDCSGANAVTTSNNLVKFTNVYRVLDGDNQSSARAIKQVAGPRCATNGLTSGAYWLEWWLEGSASFTGPWANPKVPHATTDNAQQYDATAQSWVNVIDGGGGFPVDFPFEIHGRISAALGSLDPGIDLDEVFAADLDQPSMTSVSQVPSFDPVVASPLPFETGVATTDESGSDQPVAPVIPPIQNEFWTNALTLTDLMAAF